MIVKPEIALLAWFVIGTLLMMQKNGARAITLNFLLAIMILPSNSQVDVQLLPPLHKFSVAIYTGYIGTLLFHSQAINNLCIRWYDAILAVVLGCVVMTSVVNGFGLWDGISNFLDEFLSMAAVYMLIRMHVNTPLAFRTMLLTMVYCSCFYVPFAAWEFRMSPQIHSTIYGHFQHVFIQHRRGAFWRPIVCFSHALSLARFFAFCAFIAFCPLRKALAREVPFGKWLFLIPLFGLVLSQSWGPYFMFAIFCGFYFVLNRAPLLAWVPPIAGYLWMAMVLMGNNPLDWVVESIARVNAERADSLQYRLDALNEYSVNILAKPVLGWGGWGSGRLTHRATDSAFLVRSLSRGLVGAGLLYAFYTVHIYVAADCMRRARGTPSEKDFRAILSVLPYCIAWCMVDAGLDPHLFYAMAALGAVQVSLMRYGAPVPRRRMPVFSDGGSGRPVGVRPARAARIAAKAALARRKTPL